MTPTMTHTEALQIKWRREAQRHEQGAEDIARATPLEELGRGSADDEERMLHLEIARTLRNCANELGDAIRTEAERDADLITGEYDAADVAEGGDGIVYAGTAEEAQRLRAHYCAQGMRLHGVEED